MWHCMWYVSHYILEEGRSEVVNIDSCAAATRNAFFCAIVILFASYLSSSSSRCRGILPPTPPPAAAANLKRRRVLHNAVSVCTVCVDSKHDLLVTLLRRYHCFHIDMNNIHLWLRREKKWWLNKFSANLSPTLNAVDIFFRHPPKLYESLCCCCPRWRFCLMDSKCNDTTSTGSNEEQQQQSTVREAVIWLTDFNWDVNWSGWWHFQ